MKRTLALLLGAAVSVSIFADEKKLPAEVSDYIHERNLCEHFRAEPYEGNAPEQIERREFIFESLEIYCAGTDRRLAALKRRYKDNAVVMEKLSAYEEQAEGQAKCP